MASTAGIAVALALLTATVDVKKDIATVAHAMEAGALGMSAYLNSLVVHWRHLRHAARDADPVRLLRPAAISGATYILARLTRR